MKTNLSRIRPRQQDARAGVGPCLIAGLVALLVACGPATQLRPQLGSVSELRRSAAAAAKKHPDAQAVILDEGLHVSARLGATLSDQSHATLLRKAILVQREADRDLAEISLHLGEKERLVGLVARTIAPDGSELPVNPQQIYASSAKTTNQSIQSYRFRFPRVKPGSIIEYAYVIEAERPLVQVFRMPAGQLPIDHYHLRVELPVEAAAQFRLYGLDAQPKFVRTGDNFVLDLHLTDLAADPTEPMALTPALRDPMWVLRVDRYTLQGSTWWVFSDWADAAEQAVDRITASSAGETLPAQIAVPPTQTSDPALAARSAMQRLWSELAWAGHGSIQEVRSAKAIFAAQSASSSELTALLIRQLRQAGIVAEVALTSRAWTNRFDREFATTAWINHALVYLPVQPGLTRAAWIDPACSWCAPGTVPPWLAGVTAVVARRIETKSGSEVKATLESVNAPVDSRSVAIHDYRAAVLDNRVLDLGLEFTQLGTYAGSCLAGSQPTGKQLADWTQAQVAGSGVLLGALDDPAWRRDASQGRCVRTHRNRVGGLVKQQDKQTVVSLAFLGSSFDRAWQGTQRQVRLGIEVPVQLRQRVLITDTKGGRPVGPAIAQSARHGGSSAHCTLAPEGDGWRATREIHIDAGEFTVAEYAGLRKLVLLYEQCAGRVVKFSRP